MAISHASSKTSGPLNLPVSMGHVVTNPWRETYNLAVVFHPKAPQIPPSTQLSKDLAESGVKIKLKKTVVRRQNRGKIDWTAPKPTTHIGPMPDSVVGTQHLGYANYCKNGPQDVAVIQGADISGRVTMHQRQTQLATEFKSEQSTWQPTERWMAPPSEQWAASSTEQWPAPPKQHWTSPPTEQPIWAHQHQHQHQHKSHSLFATSDAPAAPVTLPTCQGSLDALLSAPLPEAASGMPQAWQTRMQCTWPTTYAAATSGFEATANDQQAMAPIDAIGNQVPSYVPVFFAEEEQEDVQYFGGGMDNWGP
ncbi:hypothetical protein A1O7_01074 [Cladophialophora yegresii CBS 114405]|uniref:Uncharacterized protein n=1 Tax=Cladophialophora yegresii CBS 114405 TaxID=1182544 RepID=W9WJD9_9EURO|nr:uncharacterized protein A1O7_01074 [Cladophialophora yegresii CBS 114405]EXJ64736.1 hypothetical protein A1O7_01074 [Cladophialophora yegresii CBS 114405]